MVRLVFIYILGQLQHLKDTLLLRGRCKHDGEIHERSQTRTDGILVVLHHLSRTILDEIPFVHHNHKAFLVLDNERYYIHILTLNATRGVKHQHTYITVLDGTD